MGKSDDDPYLLAYSSFSFELRAVRELNRVLSKSIQTFKKEHEAKMMKKLSNLPAAKQNEVMKINRQSVDFLKTKGSFDYTSEEEIEAITSNYFINSLLLPERFSSFARNMSLVYVIVEFESFLKQLLEVTFKQRPETLTCYKKSLTFEDLLNCENLESAKQEIVDKEISDVINEGIKGQAKYFDKTFCISMEKNVDWDRFTERFYRRNTLVHNEGIADKAYRKATGCRKKNVSLKVSEKYLNETIDLFEMMADNLSNDLSKKFIIN